jgi:membrane protein YqaA with SNARE-associated domain
MGERGKHEVFPRSPRLEGERRDRVEMATRRRGATLLVLPGIPTLGLLLMAIAAGAFGIRQTAFLRWVMLGKVLRGWLFVLVSFLGLLVAGASQV